MGAGSAYRPLARTVHCLPFCNLTERQGLAGLMRARSSPTHTLLSAAVKKKQLQFTSILKRRDEQALLTQRTWQRGPEPRSEGGTGASHLKRGP
jgi:hypothetical protein